MGDTSTITGTPEASDIAWTLFCRVPRWGETAPIVRRWGTAVDLWGSAVDLDWVVTGETVMPLGESSFEVTAHSSDPSDGQRSRTFLVTVTEVES